MADPRILAATVVEVDTCVSFTLPDLCRASGAAPELLQALVDEGLLQPIGQGPADWQFSGEALPQARRARRLVRDLALNPPAVALVMDLLAEIDRLRARLR